MKNLLSLLQEHLIQHPQAQPQDIVKWVYQSFMGPGHLVSDPCAAQTRLQKEWDALDENRGEPLFSPLGMGLCRLNLRACKEIGLAPDRVNALFAETANQMHPDRTGLEQALYALRKSDLHPDLSSYLDAYEAAGCPMVSHSDVYRTTYSPAYRVVFQRYVAYLPLFAAMDRSLAAGKTIRLALDGPCASGKSTLGRWIASLYHCPLVHMDDFFLLPEMRTPQRLAQPGGNVDYERFDRDVLTPLSSGETARYRPWCCSTGCFGPEETIPPAPVTVIEGSYSLRPELRDRYTHRVWLEADWPTRRERILARGGPDVLARYESMWIPLENRYFDAFQVRNCCHFFLTGTE